jgi:hypothetical protein
MWSAVSDERTGLSFTIAAVPRQRSLSGVRVPRDLRPYITLETQSQSQSQSQSHIATDGQSINKSWFRAPSGAHDQIFITLWQLGLVFVGSPLWREDGPVFCICCWPSPAKSFSGLSSLELVTKFYCLKFETSLFVASYDSQCHGGGIRPRLHTSADIWILWLLGGRYESHRLQGFTYCVSYQRCVVHACSTAVTSVHCCPKRFTQPLSSDGRCYFILLPGKWLLRIESAIPAFTHSATILTYVFVFIIFLTVIL